MINRIIGSKVIGIKECKKNLKEDKGKVLYVAKDVTEDLIKELLSMAEEKKVEIVYVETMKELGKMSGINVKSSATLTITD